MIPHPVSQVVERVTARLEERLAEDGDEAEAAALASAVDKVRPSNTASIGNHETFLDEVISRLESHRNICQLKAIGNPAQ